MTMEHKTFLVLGRREGERLVFKVNGTEVWLSVEQLGAEEVGIGVTAPKDVGVLREEVYYRNMREHGNPWRRGR